MATFAVEATVSKETYELGMALAAMVGAVKKAGEDGWQVGQDLPTVVAAVVANIAQCVEGAKHAASEFKEDNGAFVAAVSLTAAAIMKELTK